MDCDARRAGRARVDLVHLVHLVHLVYLVCLVYLVQPNKRDRPDKQERPAGPRAPHRAVRNPEPCSHSRVSTESGVAQAEQAGLCRGVFSSGLLKKALWRGRRERDD